MMKTAVSKRMAVFINFIGILVEKTGRMNRKNILTPCAYKRILAMIDKP
jgi:hypothetical protein